VHLLLVSLGCKNGNFRGKAIDLDVGGVLEVRAAGFELSRDEST
jgi:hypothetical protein